MSICRLTTAAAEISNALAEEFPNDFFQVDVRDRICITWTDGPTVDAVVDVADSIPNDPGIVFTTRHFSFEAWHEVCQTLEIDDKAIQEDDQGNWRLVGLTNEKETAAVNMANNSIF